MKSLTNLFALLIISSILQAQVASYPFDGSGIDIISGNDATIFGATLTSDRDGNVNSAYRFDGIDDYMEVVNPIPFNFGSGEFAVSFWIRPLNQNGLRQMVFQKGNSGLIPQYWLRLNDNSSTAIRALWGNGNPPSPVIDISDSSLLFDEEWHNIVFQRTNQRNELYIDCLLVGVNNDLDRDVSSSGSLFIGAQHPLPGTSNILNHYGGDMDDLTFYDSSFDMLEVDDLCNPIEDVAEIIPIPTLGEWSMSLLVLIMLLLGVVTLKSWNSVKHKIDIIIH